MRNVDWKAHTSPESGSPSYKRLNGNHGDPLDRFYRYDALHGISPIRNNISIKTATDQSTLTGAWKLRFH